MKISKEKADEMKAFIKKNWPSMIFLGMGLFQLVLKQYIIGLALLGVGAFLMSKNSGPAKELNSEEKRARQERIFGMFTNKKTEPVQQGAQAFQQSGVQPERVVERVVYVERPKPQARVREKVRYVYVDKPNVQERITSPAPKPAASGFGGFKLNPDIIMGKKRDGSGSQGFSMGRPGGLGNFKASDAVDRMLGKKKKEQK